MIASAVRPYQIAFVSGVFAVFCCQITNAQTKFKSQMPCQLMTISIRQTGSCIVVSPISFVFVKLKIVHSPFGIYSQKMSCQPLTILAFSKPTTCLNASRKKLVTKAMLAVRPPGTFIFHIQRPPLPYGQFHLHIRSQS